ncbi:MAG: acetyl-CoA carboxylase biotin carboxyl carrier protein [bacterium]|nr:acetyl-CoA carboxylase biotin carboxyl carrier protein [bacterium]
MNMDIEYIKQIADVMDEKSLTELAIEDNGQKISLKKGAVNQVANIAPVTEHAAIASEEPQEEQPARKATPITSPMVGTFYSAASPDEEPFVQVGDVIRPGQVVCIIEAMKLMNEIEADVSGKVVEICVENGQTIEFGQVLMYIE